jgi:hypothetical protein
LRKVKVLPTLVQKVKFFSMLVQKIKVLLKMDLASLSTTWVEASSLLGAEPCGGLRRVMAGAELRVWEGQEIL